MTIRKDALVRCATARGNSEKLLYFNGLSERATARARSVSGLYVVTHRCTVLDFIAEKRHGACRNPATASANAPRKAKRAAPAVMQRSSGGKELRSCSTVRVVTAPARCLFAMGLPVHRRGVVHHRHYLRGHLQHRQQLVELRQPKVHQGGAVGRPSTAGRQRVPDPHR